MENVGFWRRLLAVILDAAILLLLPPFGIDLDLTLWKLPGRFSPGVTVTAEHYSHWLVAVYFVGFWSLCAATPGKLVLGIKVVDLELERLSPLQAVLRFGLACLLLMPPAVLLVWTVFTPDKHGLLIPAVLALGVVALSVAFDPDKRGLHDHLAGTQVVTRS